jgi:hypothetical protein
MAAHPPVVVIAPDSFKGSIAASRAASAIAEGLRRVWHDSDLRLCPMADGGEGTLDTVLSCGGQRLTARVSGASGKTVEASYGIVGEGKIAIVEAAQIVGLTDPEGTAIDVEQRSSRGIATDGQNLDGGLREFMVGLGGTSTNDGSAGMLAALGVQLLDAGGAPDARDTRKLPRSPRWMLVDSIRVSYWRRSPSCPMSTTYLPVLAEPPQSSAPKKACAPSASANSTRGSRASRRWLKKRWEKLRTIGPAPARRAVWVLRFSCWAAKCAPGRKSSPTWSGSMRQSEAPTG